MELQQLKLGDKVKLKLIQPQFKCSGREETTCFYRGEIVIIPQFNSVMIEFKYKGKIIREWYQENLGFRRKDINDIKII